MNGQYDIKAEILEKQLEEARREINALKLAVRAEDLKVRIASEYSNFGLWEYDIADDICYQYKKLNGIYENDLDPIVHFRDTIIGWGSVYVDDIPVFHSFCDAMERGDKDICCDVRVINDYSDIVWFRYEGKTIYDDNGIPLRVIGRTLDVTEEKGGTGVETDNIHDFLTGAYLYDSFIEKAERRAAEKSFKSSALIVIGIDRYEELDASNDCDTDDIQRSLAKVLDAQSAVEQGSLYARVKDGLFAFYVKFSDIPNLNAIAARLVFRFHDFRLIDTESGKRITISAGVALFGYKKNYEQVYNEALTALGAAMKKGGNGYLQYNASMSAPRNTDANEDILNEITGSAGAEKIYHLINRAVTDTNSCEALIKLAIEQAGKYTSSTCTYVTLFKNGVPEHHLLWSADGAKEYSPELPAIIPAVSQGTLSDILQGTAHIAISEDRSDDAHSNGMKHINGGYCSMIAPIFAEGAMIGLLSFVNDSARTWQASDVELIDNISLTLSYIAGRQILAERAKRRAGFTGAVVNGLGIEAFTIDPTTFTVDHPGDNMASQHGLRKGDICYKRLYELDSPCEDCPLHQINAGQLTASCAHYNAFENRWENIAASIMETTDGSTRCAVSKVDITSTLDKVQTHDTLTGVLGFDRFAVDAMRITAQNSECGFITVINIANFRRLNENMGYEFGNSVLIAVSDVLSGSIGKDELLCRSEGARFVALYRNKSADELLPRLKQILQSAQKRVEEKCGTQIFLVAGAFEMSGENIGIMASLDRAIIAQKTVKDKAYYSSNMIVFYDKNFQEDLQTRQYIETHMMDALENNEFKVFYQPQVNAQTGEIVGAEALVRWIRPNGEMISPGKFIPIFEQNGFIADMDFAIYRRAIADVRRWLRAGIVPPVISLNISRHHMMDDSFPAKICALVDALGVPHNMLELEITESMLTQNMNKLLDIMTQLKEAGFRIAVDDFGSGYSSLNLITLLPFDTLKIDGGFFLKNELTEKNKAVITSVMEMAKNLKLYTVSEGVETDEQVEFLREIGCDTIQGYYFHKPMPVLDFEALMSQKGE